MAGEIVPSDALTEKQVPLQDEITAPTVSHDIMSPSSANELTNLWSKRLQTHGDEVGLKPAMPFVVVETSMDGGNVLSNGACASSKSTLFAVITDPLNSNNQHLCRIAVVVEYDPADIYHVADVRFRWEAASLLDAGLVCGEVTSLALNSELSQLMVVRAPVPHLRNTPIDTTDSSGVLQLFSVSLDKLSLVYSEPLVSPVSQLVLSSFGHSVRSTQSVEKPPMERTSGQHNIEMSGGTSASKYRAVMQPHGAMTAAARGEIATCANTLRGWFLSSNGREYAVLGNCLPSGDVRAPTGKACFHEMPLGRPACSDSKHSVDEKWHMSSVPKSGLTQIFARQYYGAPRAVLSSDIVPPSANSPKHPLLLGTDKKGNLFLYMQHRQSSFAGPMYPLGYHLIKQVEAKIEREDELDTVLVTPKREVNGDVDTKEDGKEQTEETVSCGRPFTYTPTCCKNSNCEPPKPVSFSIKSHSSAAEAVTTSGEGVPPTPPTERAISGDAVVDGDEVGQAVSSSCSSATCGATGDDGRGAVARETEALPDNQRLFGPLVAQEIPQERMNRFLLKLPLSTVSRAERRARYKAHKLKPYERDSTRIDISLSSPLAKVWAESPIGSGAAVGPPSIAAALSVLPTAGSSTQVMTYHSLLGADDEKQSDVASRKRPHLSAADAGSLFFDQFFHVPSKIRTKEFASHVSNSLAVGNKIIDHGADDDFILNRFEQFTEGVIKATVTEEDRKEKVRVALAARKAKKLQQKLEEVEAAKTAAAASAELLVAEQNYAAITEEPNDTEPLTDQKIEYQLLPEQPSAYGGAALEPLLPVSEVDGALGKQGSVFVDEPASQGAMDIALSDPPPLRPVAENQTQS